MTTLLFDNLIKVWENPLFDFAQNTKCVSCERTVYSISHKSKISICTLCEEAGMNEIVDDLFIKFDRGEMNIDIFGRFKYRPIVIAAWKAWKLERKEELEKINKGLK